MHASILRACVLSLRLITPRLVVCAPQSKNCAPGGDGGLGWAISTLYPPANVTVFDMTYANRFQHFRGGNSERELILRTAVLHQARRWKQHFQWALCLSTPPHHSPPHSLALQTERAPVMGCRGAVTQKNTRGLHCGELRCHGNRSLVHTGTACALDHECAQYYNSTFASWAFCINVQSRRVPRRARLSNASICNASQDEVLRMCGSGGGIYT